MIFAVSQLSLMGVFVKIIGPSYHPTQISFLRNLVALLIMLPFLFQKSGFSILKTNRFFLHLLRALAGVSGNILFFHAFQRLPLSHVTVVSQAVPIFVTILAVWILNENVGWRRWLAIFIGFIGVLIAINPTGNFNYVSLIALIATAFWATTILIMRSLGSSESPYSVVFYFMLIGTVITGIFQPWVWQSPDLKVLILLFGVGVTGALGQLLMSYALKLAEASIISPFNYTGIIWAIGFDVAIWNILPNLTTCLGAILITVAGIYIFRREAYVRLVKKKG